MRIGLVSNWGQVIGCGVGSFGLDFLDALRTAGYEASKCDWNDTAGFDKVIVNWDSGTLPKDEPVPPGSVVFVHHVYRGRPEGLEQASRVLCPMRGAIPGAEYFPYPIATYRAAQTVMPGTVGVTTIRKEGLDYLGAACARRGLRLCAPDRWLTAEEEIDRLARCQLLAAWYTDSPGRSLALATMLAAQRPTLLSAGSQMFEYAAGSEEIYWVPYTNQDVEIIAQGFDRVLADCAAGTERIPRVLAESWSWPRAIAALEALW
jgi:hypothetical protein